MTGEEIKKKFESMIIPHMDALFGTAQRMTRNQRDAEDLLQETFLKAYRSIHQFEEGTNFRAWLFKILVNTYISQYRKKSKEPKQMSYDNLEEFYLFQQMEKTGSHQQKTELLDELFDDDVSNALEELPDPFRVVIQLADIEDFSYKEISGILNVPIGTVMSRLFRGRKILEKNLWEYARKKGFVKGEKK
jgi:RNA polymerase sigma-70 factor (ECF subfamily)